jgi:hypothetical protein
MVFWEGFVVYILRVVISQISAEYALYVESEIYYVYFVYERKNKEHPEEKGLRFLRVVKNDRSRIGYVDEDIGITIKANEGIFEWH